MATLLVRVVVAGAVVAAVYTALSLGISSLTDRRAIASAGVLLTIVGTSAVVNVLVDGIGVGEWLYMFNLSTAPFELVTASTASRGTSTPASCRSSSATPSGWCSAPSTIWWRYRRIEVTK